jgi:hypothetical protein
MHLSLLLSDGWLARGQASPLLAVHLPHQMDGKSTLIRRHDRLVDHCGAQKSNRLSVPMATTAARAWDQPDWTPKFPVLRFEFPDPPK